MKTINIPIYQRIEDLYHALGLSRTLPYAGFDAFRRERPDNIRDAMSSYRQGFFSVGLLQDELAQTNVNDIQLRSFQSVLLVVNPEQVVSWSGRFQSGYVLNFEVDFLGNLFSRNDFLFLQSNFGGIIDVGDSAPLFVTLFEQLISEYAHPTADTTQIIRHYVMALLYKIRQHIRTHQATLGRFSQADRATVITERFRVLIDQLGDERKPIKAYADELAVSPAYLSEAVKRSTGRSARELLYEVQLRTARSLLRQTDLTIEQIALQLGFHTHAHFSHFFRTQTGQSPAQYRNS
jgi:AraC family transcriptional activator of pobA